MPFFLFGFLYYLISPVLVLQGFSADNELLNVANKYLDSGYFDIFYFLDALLILASFLFGYFAARLLTRKRSGLLDYGSYQKSFPQILAISLFALISYFTVSAISSGASFFSGYSTYNILILGPMSTCAFLSVWFVNYFSRKQIKFLFLCLFVICSILLLGWGSRMFFALGFVALVLGFVLPNIVLVSMWFYIGVGACSLFIIMVGILREGGSEFSSDNMLAVLFAEFCSHQYPEPSTLKTYPADRFTAFPMTFLHP